MKILEYTFQHLNGFGSIKEKELRKGNILNWDDFERNFSQQLNFEFIETTSILSESKKRLLNKDAAFFTERLPSNLHFLIPYSFPEDTIFLDIETTGLSLYYDNLTIVGWSKQNEYDVFVKGDKEKESKLISELSQAKCIITFNGSNFDLPFLKKEFKKINLPVCHIDLRFFSKRVGYQGGQKKIEKQLGIARPNELVDVDGYEATLLWHKYKNGDVDSLKRLIEYNICDVEGMRSIFERLTTELIEKENFPFKSSNIYPFSQTSFKYEFAENPGDNGIFVTPYTGRKGPLITINSLAGVAHEVVVGIDLTGSEKKPTGWCVLSNNRAYTKTILTDDELISETIKHNPKIISIDSPLSIPEGRTSFFDNDPKRDEFGITRACERIMAKRGIKSYPCLIPTMQKLTQRGMSLAQKFRDLGFEVIESYPGAAQDIIGIPRKGKSLEYLINGLRDFGVIGTFDRPGVTHDEIDAITSAVVGLFYLSNQYEALGNDVEGYLIVPQITLV